MRLAFIFAVMVFGCGSSRDTSSTGSGSGSAATTPAGSAKTKCVLKGSCKPCKGVPDCPGETCTHYAISGKHYSACVDDRGCSVGDVMWQTSDLCGTKNPD